MGTSLFIEVGGEVSKSISLGTIKVVGVSRGRWWVEDLLDRVNGLSVELVVSDVPTRVYPIVVIGEAFGVNYSVWALYFREVWKGFSPIDDQAKFSYVRFQVGVGKRKVSEEIGRSLVQELIDDLGTMSGNVVKPKLVCFVVDG